MIKINNTIVNFSKFPDGTTSSRINIDLQTLNKEVIITWQYQQDESEMVQLFYLVSHLKNLKKEIVLRLPYCLQARMDRVKDNTEIFTLKYFCNFINSLNFEKVVVLDPHSNVSPALINNVVVTSPKHGIQEAFNSFKERSDKPMIIFFPDEGSSKRYGDMVEGNRAFGIKKRDWKTGTILGLDVVGEIPNGPFDVLIVDDISSYGGTFFHSAKKLKALGADRIGLYVTHCEENILKGDLAKSKIIEQVYTLNPLFKVEDDWIKVVGNFMTFDDASNIEIDNIYPMDIIYDMIIDGIIKKVKD